jgi:hypothetical protein
MAESLYSSVVWQVAMKYSSRVHKAGLDVVCTNSVLRTESDITSNQTWDCDSQEPDVSQCASCKELLGGLLWSRQQLLPAADGNTAAASFNVPS